VSEAQTKFMDRFFELRALIAASDTSASSMNALRDAVIEHYGKLIDELPPDHQWRRKLDHALGASEAMRSYSEIFGFTPGEAAVLSALLLMHDIGRVKQGILRSKGETSADADHGQLGVHEICEALGITEDGATPLMKAMLTAVRFHSYRATPSLDEVGYEAAYALVQLLRDLDKLELFRGKAKKYTEDLAEQARQRLANWEKELFFDPAWGLPMYRFDPPCMFWSDFLSERTLDRQQVRSYECFMILFLGMLNDINLPEVLEILRESGVTNIVYAYIVRQLQSGAEHLALRSERIEAGRQLDAFQEFAKTWIGGILLATPEQRLESLTSGIKAAEGYEEPDRQQT
jgi:hypothetical protein